MTGLRDTDGVPRTTLGAPSDRDAQPDATSDARILHVCGHYVYTERPGAAAPRFPATCPHCAKPVKV